MTSVSQFNGIIISQLIIIKMPAIDSWVSPADDGISRQIDRGWSMSLKSGKREALPP